MSLKKDLAKEISIIEKEMHELEIKRTRSMAALVEALVSKKEPPENEMRFFRQYTAEIDVKREKLKELNDQLKALL